MKKIAVLDFDKTLSECFISMEFLDYLADRGIYRIQDYQRQMKLLEAYQYGRLSYDEWCKKWGEEWAQGLKGKNQATMQNYARSFFEGFKHHIFPESYALIRELKQNRHETIILSVGASQVIDLTGLELGVNKVYATRLSVKNGFYDGQISTSMHLPSGKARQLSDILKNGGVNIKESAGYGDSDSDIEFIEMLGKRFAVNPSTELRAYASENKWKILEFSR